MGEWQNKELAGETEIAYVMGLWQNLEGAVPTADNLDRWESDLGFQATEMVLDYNQEVMSQYEAANPALTVTNAVTVIIDKQGIIRSVTGTYDSDHEATLNLLLELAAE